MENTAILKNAMNILTEEIQKMKTFIALLLLLILFPATGGCAITHKYGPYYGKVVDAETKEPIEGAAVLIVYKTEQYGLAGPVSHFADAQETITDKNGEFEISAIRINKLRIISGWERHPEVRIFKPGYGCYPKHRDVRPVFDYGSLPANAYVTVELPKLRTKEERIVNYGCYPSPSVPKIKYRKLLHLINQDAVTLGLEPDKELMEEK